MPNTKLTKDNLKNHLHYNKTAYLIILVVAIFVGDLLFSITTYRAPNARNVEVELVCGYADTEKLIPYEETALEAMKAYETERDRAAGIDVDAAGYQPQVYSVNFLLLGYDPNGEEAYYGAQKYMVTMAAQEGDIFIVERGLMEGLVHDGLAVDLTPYIESGVIDPGDRDLSRVTFNEYVDVEAGEKQTGNTCVYALQAGEMTGLWDAAQFNPTDKYMVLMGYSENQDTAAAMMQWMIDEFEPDEAETADDAGDETASEGEKAE